MARKRGQEGQAAGQLVTRVELARRLGQHPRTVAKWLEEGLPVKERGRGGRASKFDELEVRVWLEARNRAAAADGGELNWSQERARKEHWQALLAEQQHRMRERELLPAAEVAKVWAGHIAAVRTRLLSWPATLADRVHRAATLAGLPGVERELGAAVREVLLELAGEGERATEKPPPKRRRRVA